MSEKIIVPRGMYLAALKHQDSEILCRSALEAAIRWLTDNPAMPSPDDCRAIQKVMADRHKMGPCDEWDNFRIVAVEWQRRMFLAPEPAIDPVAIAATVDLRWLDPDPRSKGHNNAVLEAYRRGKESA